MTERATQGERTPSCARPADVGARSPECAIRYEDVSFSYKAGTLFMEGLSAAIPAGAVTSIVGPNGCGKSTLVKLAAGLLRPTAGRVEVAGHDTASLASRERAHLMAVLAQSSRVPPMTVEALVACGRHPHLGWGGRLGPDDRAAVEAAMERAGVAAFHNHDLRQLSGGERQRAHLARTLAQDTDLIVLDEPTTYLDISDYLVVMQKGRVTAQGPTDEVLASGAVGDAFHMDICPHDRLSSMRDEAVAGARAETDRGYVLYPRRR